MVCLQLHACELEMRQVQQELNELQERSSWSAEAWAEKEMQLESRQQMLDERVDSLTRQNQLLHSEAEKVRVFIRTYVRSYECRCVLK